MAGAPTASGLPAAPPVARQTVRVGGVPTFAFAPFLIGQERGYFAEEGLDLEIVNIASGAESIPQLAAGHVDAVTVAPTAGLANAMLRGLPVRIVAGAGSIRRGRNLANIVIRKDLAPPSGYTDLVALAKPIRTGLTAEGSLPHAILLLEFEQAGIAPEDVSLVYLGLPDINAALASGNLDVAGTGEPLITIGEQQGALARWKPMADLYPDMPYGVLLYGVNLLERDRDAGERLLVAFVRAIRDYEDAFIKGKDRDAIIGILSQPLRIPAPLFQTLQERGGLAYLDPNGAIHVEPLRPVLERWARAGLVPPGLDPHDLVDGAFVQRALARLGPYE
jgi:ABC-type nitrate/sulfonate/bicarbonate transport system substrate-binding protein